MHREEEGPLRVQRRRRRPIFDDPHFAGGKFLEQFIGGAKWVHMDIAGPAWAEGETAALDPGGTGCMVRSIVEMASQFGSSS